MGKSVVGVRFKKVGKIYYFDPLDIVFEQFDPVIVETVRGIEYGEIALTARDVDEAEIVAPVKPVIRKATETDTREFNKLKQNEQDAKAIFTAKAKKHKLEMKLIDVEYTFDQKKAIFYFTAEGRVDFRELVKDLASIFKVRIELRQIGVRDEAKLFKGLGVCGRTTCCAQWLGDFTPVSIKMAKEQNLSLNSTKISGICGRLLCCLTYEQEFYEEVSKKLPKVGQRVITADGEGEVFKLSILEETVFVKIQVNKDETEVKKYLLEEIEVKKFEKVKKDK
ncbi:MULTISPECIES: PSP1 domain-containing protein [Acetobacterium]|jgi:cell fate regulator YaaT (PSP1 superfamily)|uniref:Stage 0 sporulation family protein n=1 Tax=Acetobacterium wieringae TaxID=52694 RepID=A0A5D0WSR0_9FIRM|nr:MULTISPECIES: stage 0 sporulation family protein [Acetobacterium]TYC87209.1 stage 0 sporulation family protein [Acetobacterium wieringae]